MDIQSTWQKILEQIKKQISSANFKTWFSQATIMEITDTNLKISVPSAFIKNQLVARYEVILNQSIEEITGKKLTIEYEIDSSKLAKKTKPELGEEEDADIFTINPSYQGPQNSLNKKYTLDSFVVGFTNNLAYAAAQAITQNPGLSYNPLFVYGPSGVGKTHLMHGVGNAIISKNPYSKILYVSSEKFMNDFVDSIQNKKTGEFRQRYRYCDVFLVDDIQFIAGKDSTQEEFFHTFNELHSKNAQIILTSDRPPHEMHKLEARLLSRFQGGLMVDIQLPDFDTRMAILKRKLQEKGDQLPEDILKLIAETVESNTRELEGKLIQIIQISKLKQEEITVDEVRKFLGRPQTTTQKLDHKKILTGINQYFNTKLSDITGPRRQKELVLPRQIAMYLMYEECKMPFEKIGQVLGGRDHTTILHGVEKIRDAVSRDREVQRLVIEIKQHLLS